MSASPKDQINKRLGDFETQYSVELAEFPSKANELRDVCITIERTWSGSFIGWHGKMYFRDFQVPSHYERFSGEWGDIHGLPEGWEEKDADAVREKINELMGSDFSIERFEDDTNNVRSALRDLQKEVDLFLSAISVPNPSKAAEYLSELKTTELGQPKADFVNLRLPKNRMSRDTEALAQGICIPSWLYFEGVAIEARKITEWIDNYKKTIRRFFQALEMNNPTAVGKTSLTQFALHPGIVSKCASLYDANAYPEAVEKSFKVVRDRLRTLTGHETGSEAFGKGHLHIKGAAATNVEGDFNQAVKFLTMAIDMFRNEKSHTSDANIDDPVRAYQYLVLSSLAMYFLDQAEIKT
jgi:uncharacterized protein (TIGR02391 family)